MASSAAKKAAKDSWVRRTVMSTGARCQYRASELQPIADVLEAHGFTRDMLKDLSDEEAEGMLIPRNLAAALRETANGKPAWMKSGPVPQFSGFEDCDDPVKRSGADDTEAPKARHGFPTYETKPAGVTWVRAHGGFPTPLRDYEPKHPATIARVGLPVRDAQPWKQEAGVGLPVREAPAPPTPAPAASRPLSARSHTGQFAGSARVAPRSPSSLTVTNGNAQPQFIGTVDREPRSERAPRHLSQDDRVPKTPSQRTAWASPRPSSRIMNDQSCTPAAGGAWARAGSGERVIRAAKLESDSQELRAEQRSPSPRQRHASPAQIRQPSPKQGFSHSSPRQLRPPLQANSTSCAGSGTSAVRRESRHRSQTHGGTSPARATSSEHQERAKAVSFGPPPKSAEEKAALLNDFLAEWTQYGLRVEDKD